jgi:hypothetical protein
VNAADRDMKPENDPLVAVRRKSTELFRVRRGVLLHKTALALPPHLVAAFKSACAAQCTTMSLTVERWIGEYLATLEPGEPPVPPPSTD